jgi:hypothetical protein
MSTHGKIKLTKTPIIEKIKIVGSISAISGFIVMYFLFVTAYANENKSTCFNINNYGEATIELYLITIQLIVAIIGITCIILFRNRNPPPSPHNENTKPTTSLRSV